MNGAVSTVMMDQAIRRYRGDLQSWLQRIRLARNVKEKARIFGMRPNPAGPMAGVIRGMVSGDRTRATAEAERMVETALKEEIEDLSVTELDAVANMIAGHAPRLAIMARNRLGSLRRRERGEGHG